MGLTGGTMNVATTVSVTGRLASTGTAVDKSLAARTAAPAALAEAALAFGAGSGRIDVPCDGEYVLAAGASVTLNLYDGGVTDSDLTTVFGGAANLRLLKGLAVCITDGGDAAGVTIGGAASNQWVGFFGASGDTLTIYPDGPAFAVGSPAGVAVGSSTKNLKILNNGAVEVRVAVFAAGSTAAGGYAMGLFPLLTYP
jgi:hypothetical protein